MQAVAGAFGYFRGGAGVKLSQHVHTALDELRMQMLGAQVLFGFQFQGVFQEGFKRVSENAKNADIIALGLLTATLGFLLAPCAQHRLVERGIATKRIVAVASVFSKFALASYALAIGFDVFAVADPHFGEAMAIKAGVAATLLAAMLWYALGIVIGLMIEKRRMTMPDREEPARTKRLIRC